MLKERDQRSSYRGYLLRRDVHKFNLFWRNYREIRITACLDTGAYKLTLLIVRSITLTNDLVLLFFGCQIFYLVIIEVDMAVLNLAIRSFNKS